MEPGVRPAFSLPSDNQIRLILVILAGLVFAVWVGVQVGQEKTKMVAGLGLSVALVMLMLALGRHAWLMLPIGMTLDVPVPITFGRDFSAKELTSMLFIGFTVFQVALRRQKAIVFRKEHLWPLLYAGWALLVFVHNPSGLFIFGGDVVGARYYFNIALALGVFLAAANVTIEERDVKWMLGLMLASMLINVLYAWWQTRSSGDAVVFQSFGEEGFYTWHQTLVDPCVFILMFAVSHFPLRELFSIRRVGWWPVLLVAVILDIWSGKRMGFARLLALPIFAAVSWREFGRGGVLTALALGGVLLLASGQGAFYDLPLSAQRAMSFLPGKWHPSAGIGTDDEFRKFLRQDALERIQKSPWIGPGFALSISEYWADSYTDRRLITGIRAGGSWHTTWFGIGADFGLPAVAIWFFLVLGFTRTSYRLCRVLPQGDWRRTMAAYIFISICFYWMSSYTSGHSALTPFTCWWLWALLLPLARAFEPGNTVPSMKPLRESLRKPWG